MLWDQPPPQALRFSHGGGESETRVTGDEPQGTMGRVQPSRPLSPSRLPLSAHFHQERDVWVRGSYTKEWNRTYLICDAPLSRLARRSFASLLKSCPNHLYVWTEARTSAGVPDKAIRYSVLNIAQSLNPRSLAKRVVNLNWTKSALIIYKKVQFTCLLQIVLSQIKRGKSEHRWNFIP